jgi:hypothetical protein
MMFTECGQCGWIGPLTELNEHPTRPMPMDLGFCPECGCECEVIYNEDEIAKIIADYE